MLLDLRQSLQVRLRPAGYSLAHGEIINAGPMPAAPPPAALPRSRLEWITVGRGVAILMVVLGHTPIPAGLQGVLQPFRLPLFYITAGYLFNYERHRDGLGFYLGRRTRRLLIPYGITALFFYFVWWGQAILDGGPSQNDPLKKFAAIFLASGAVRSGPGDYTIQYDRPLWFLGCMAAATAIFVGLLHFFKDREHRAQMVFASLILAAIGRSISHNVFLPWSLDVAMNAQFFIVLGFLLREYRVQFSSGPVFAGFALIYAFLCYDGCAVDMNKRIYPDFATFFAAGLAGTYCVFYLGRALVARLESEKTAHYLFAPLAFCGRHAMVILAFHWGGFYLQHFFSRSLHGRLDNSPAVPYTFACLMAASLGAIGVIHAVPRLKKIYYSE